MSDTTTAPPQATEAAQFDFWVGDWLLTWGENRDQHGTNRITKILDDKVIFEHFVSQSHAGFEGMSHSVWDTTSNQWKQTWVDSQGSYLDFTGGYADGKMILSRQTVREGRPVRQRMVWYNITADALEWNWERSLDDGATWEILWHIIYQRRK